MASEDSEINQVDLNDSQTREEVKTAGFNSRAAAPDDDETVIHEVDEENNPEDALYMEKD